MKTAKNKPGARMLSTLHCLILLVSYGCSSTQGERVILHPAKYRVEGYTRSADQWVFKNGNVNMRVFHARPDVGGPDARESILVDELNERGYLLLRVVIRNDSDFDIIYNPALTIFKDGTLGYKKPLDYTGLYDLFAKDAARGELKDYSKLFYDMSATIRPGERSSKLLAFKPIDKGARKGKLVIKNLYVDKDIIDVSFPFVLEVEKVR